MAKRPRAPRLYAWRDGYEVVTRISLFGMHWVLVRTDSGHLTFGYERAYRDAWAAYVEHERYERERMQQ